MKTIARKRSGDGPAVGWADLLPGAIGLLILGVQPIMLGALHAAGRIDETQLGVIAMAEILALTLGIFAGQWYGAGIALKQGALLALLALAAANLASLGATGTGLLLVRAGAGLPAGWLVWITAAAIVRSPDPTVMAGRFILLQVAMQALLATLANGLAAQSTAFVPLCLACVAGAGLLVRSRLAALVKEASDHQPPTLRWTEALPALGAALAFQAAVMAAWVYMEPLAMLAQLDAAATALATPLSLGAQLAGCVVAIRLCRVADWIWPICCGSALLVLGFATLAGAQGAGAFLGKQVAIGFVWTLVSPFFTAMALDGDRSGRTAIALPGAIMLGSVLGPGLAAFAVGLAGTPGLLRLCSGLAGLAVVLALWGRWQLARPRSLRG